VLELDAALRQQTLQQLQTQSTRLTELADDLLLGQPAIGADPVVYARPVQTPGDTFVWPSYEDQDHRQPWQSAATSDNEPQLRWQAAADDRYLYLLTDVQQHSLTPFNPARPEQPYDRFELWLQAPASDLEQPAGPRIWHIKPDEARATTAREPERRDYRVHATWRIRTNSWQLEVRMPLPAQPSC
ncbi:MAG TPA: hypothetical protein VK971_00200, partial [Thiohalobacter sp.]|nr:hypothetical protein [Thiohalobacter sp.]